MRRVTRLTLIVVAAMSALAFASSALASFTPKILVSPVAVLGGVSVSASVGANDAPTAKVSIYVPTGYTLAAASAPGTKLGSVTATASAADLGGAVLPLTGDLLVGDKTTPAITQAAQACGTTTATAVWILHLTAAGQTLDIPMFVVATAGPELTVGPTKLVICLPPPDVPVGTPGRAVFGAKLLSATFNSSGLIPPASTGDYRWTSLWTPYNPGQGTPNAAGSVEVQSIAHFPTGIEMATQKKKLVKYKTVRIHGKKHRVIASVRTSVKWGATVSQATTFVAGAQVVASVNGKVIGTKATNSAGVVSFAFILAKGTASLKLTATIPDQDLGISGCVASPIFQGLPCTDATAGGGTVSETGKVTAFKK